MERSAFFAGVNSPTCPLMSLTYCEVTPGRTAMILFAAPSFLLGADGVGIEGEAATPAVDAVSLLDSGIAPSSANDVTP